MEGSAMSDTLQTIILFTPLALVAVAAVSGGLYLRRRHRHHH